MSVRIHWRPADDNGRAFKTGTSSSLSKLLEALGDELGPEDVTALRAMAVAAKDEFYSEVADVIERAGRIKIKGVW